MLGRDPAGIDVSAIMTAAVDACEPATRGCGHREQPQVPSGSLPLPTLTPAEEASIQHSLMHAGIFKQAACLLPEILTLLWRVT